MRAIIYCQEINTGMNKLNDIIHNYAKINIETTNIKRITKTSVFIVFKNGDEWTVAIANDGSRGRACNIAYIDRNINEEIVQTIIMPTIKAYPYQAYQYYN